MVVFAILKKFAQVLGVFPFIQQNVFKISKLYLIVNVFIAFYLISITGRNVLLALPTVFNKSAQVRHNRQDSMGIILTKLVLFFQITDSCTTLVMKFLLRKKQIAILNAIVNFMREHKVKTILNSTVTSDYSFIALLFILLGIEIINIDVENRIAHELSTDYNYTSGIQIPIIMDEIILCVVCSALAKCQLWISEMISNLVVERNTQEIIEDNNPTTFEIVNGDVLESRIGLHQDEVVVKRSIENHPHGRRVSKLAKKLEALRQMNLKLLNYHERYSALNQYHLCLATAASTTEIILSIFSICFYFANKEKFDQDYATPQTIKYFGDLISNVIRLCMLCYYNDRAFNAGIATKYAVQQIRRTTHDEDLEKVSKVFLEQLRTRSQFQICGIFAFNMTLPSTFMDYAAQYTVVLIQYLGMQMSKV